jgi:uncharacterized lipoprotein YmbA
VNRKRSWWLACILCGLFLGVLGGCVKKKSAPTNFYMLNPLSPAAIELKFVERDRCTLVGVEPIHFPAYLDRPQFVIREGPFQYRLAEFDRWAEPLQSNVERVLLENLNTALSGVPLAVVRQDSFLRIDYALRVMILRMESDDAGRVQLDAGWLILDDEDENVILAKMSSYRVQSASRAYEDIAAAQSETLDSLGREIAVHLKTLVP